MLKLEHAIDIRRTPAEVFSFLSVHSNHVKFVEENISSEQVSPGPMQVGTHVKNTAKAMGIKMEEHFEIVAFEPPHVLGKASMKGSTFETTDRFELTETSDGTHVRLLLTVTPRSFKDRVISTLMTPVLNRSLRKSLGKLKALLEAKS